MDRTVDPVAALDSLDRVGTALADPTRRKILLELTAGPAYPAELADRWGIGRTSISNHLGCLRGCGIVVATREGRNVRYELASAELSRSLVELAGLTLVIDEDHRDLDGRN